VWQRAHGRSRAVTGEAVRSDISLEFSIPRMDRSRIDTPTTGEPAVAPEVSSAPRGDGATKTRWSQRISAAYVAAVIVVGSLLLAWTVQDVLRRPPETGWLILLGLTIASGWATLRVPGMPISFSISDIFSIASALLFGPSAGAITASLDGLVLSSRMATSRRSLHRVAFNGSAPAIAMWVATQAFLALVGPSPSIRGPADAVLLLAALALFGGIAFVLTTGVVATAVSLERRLGIVATWRQHFAGLWLSYFGGVFGGMLLMLLFRTYTPDVIILLIPLPVILYTAFRHAVGRTQDQISHLGKVNRVYVAAIEALAQAVDAKDQVTHDHVRRVQNRAVELARGLGVDDEGEVQAIKAASLLHDVGKLAIPEHILNKPGRLTAAEYEIMKRHAPIGADILSVIDFPYPVAPIVRHHHENWDGTGYPDGLSGDRIPIGARILAVVDCFDALTSDRPYRPRLEDADALKVIADRRGTMYDPKVVDAFLAFHGIETPAALPAATAPAAPEPAAPREEPPAAPAGRELATFFALGRALSVPCRPAQLAGIVAAHLEPYLPPSTLVLYAYTEASDSIALMCQAGNVPFGLSADVRIPLGERLSGWVAATGESVLNSDARLDLDEAQRESSPFRSTLAVPVAVRTRLIGVLSVYSATADAFDPAHRRLVEAAAVALADAAADVFSSAADLPAWASRHQTRRVS
jgi:putative nucleotidyltransferase with HDIG domain